ncbi:hypothetical protein EV210_12116 [Anaerospora hongkongensis]|uniref:DUF6680 domain-containing protein n=1 Tax=Anaerospora hongkongensis TaxID=244830 RepID=A0A4R1PRJ3_9FIRM|nr:DUF6680 family protein [Anaerospora hongkongensis]TCL32451.1 hypothetical protein EV210_12116 [Anaerospora hongkongensis]
METLSLKDVIEILAVLLSPLIALQVSECLKKRNEKRERKHYVFKTLMKTRASNLDQAHVEALNMVDVEFANNTKNDKAVIEAWKVLVDHLGIHNLPSEVWENKRVELLFKLLEKMARSLDYNLSETDIKRTSYFPKGYADLEMEQQDIRRGFTEIFRGNKFFPVMVYSPEITSVQEAAATSDSRNHR